MSQPIPVMIRGTGSYVPDEVLTNEFFASYLDTSDEWIVPRTGIRERRRAAEGEATVSLAKAAAEAALADAGIKATELDLILVATASPDTPLPATACWLQAELGAANIPAFDLSAACSGFVYGLVVAGSMMQYCGYNNALVIGAETLTRMTDYQDRATCILFGDAAGAAVISPSDDPSRQILHHTLGAEGTEAEAIWVPAGGSRLPASEMTVAEQLHFMKMKGGDLFKFAVNKLSEMVDQALQATGIAADDLTMVIPHQSNLRIMESARRRLGLPKEKMGVNIERYGNTSAASIPLMLDEARRDGRLSQGDLVLLLGFGAGVTWGSALIRL